MSRVSQPTGLLRVLTQAVAVSLMSVLLVIGLEARVGEAEASIQKPLSEEDLCRIADVVVVGKVLERKSYHAPEALNAVVTEARIGVEAIAHGTVGSEISITALGGRIGQQRAYSPGSPWFTIGARFVLFLHTVEKHEEREYAIVRWAQIDATADIPPSPVLADIWSEHCTPNIVGDTQGKPTEPYLLLLPEWFFDWCKHYKQSNSGDASGDETRPPTQ